MLLGKAPLPVSLLLSFSVSLKIFLPNAANILLLRPLFGKALSYGEAKGKSHKLFTLVKWQKNMVVYQHNLQCASIRIGIIMITIKPST